MTVLLLTAIVMLAFAGNSILTRIALDAALIDPASFAVVRLLSATVVLILLLPSPPSARDGHPNRLITWLSALSLFSYVMFFSFAYVSLSAGFGALVLFGSVQLTMIGYSYLKGEKFSPIQWFGFGLTIIGTIMLYLPSLSFDGALSSIIMMSLAGLAWGLFSIIGTRQQAQPLYTSQIFTKAAPFSLALLAATILSSTELLTIKGLLLALSCGVLTTGLGYSLWYLVLKQLSAGSAAVSQLSVPVITMMIGNLFLGENLSNEMLSSSCLILIGLALFMLAKYHQQSLVKH